MTLVRWRPVTDITSIQNEIDRVFDSFFRTGVPAGSQGYAWAPAVDVRENAEAFTLVAEVPGISKEDLQISFTDGVLTLRGEKKVEQEFSNENWHQVERAFGRFERHIRLTAPVDATKIKARVQDGVLTVNVPKAEDAKPREIKIEF